MATESPAPRVPRLRGLNPELLLGVLDDDSGQNRPVIPGWHISGVAGEGGSGVVWKAQRESDGIFAAIKIASSGEPDTVERIEREAGFLRELQHPHIVALMETGPMEEGSEAGGLYLAMEFIDGPALIHEIPENGLPPERAFHWFRQIAEAVAHAHDAGILHRDLKPANVLIDPEGQIKVADFGLARPVHRRVHQLSLTRAGLVAGTAEYLPPEAYRRDYRPGPAADIFALGVILHEMLTGTPPRGAWQAASMQGRVDVRIDEIIRRAMAPNPERRWPDARAMLTALNEVTTSPPRYSGAPLVTFPVRVADCLWTLAGLFMAIAGLSSMMRIRKAWLALPFDLVGDHGKMIGGFHALSMITLVGIPLGLWQLARLRRFRHIPLREALPSPLGLRLGNSRTAAGLVFSCQFICLVIPILQMMGLYIESSTVWIRAGDPPWMHGLAVTHLEELTPVSPWTFVGVHDPHWLWESEGPPGHALAKTIERISFYPFFAPAIMVVGGLLPLVALLATAIVACHSWWCRKHQLRTVLMALATVFLICNLADARGNAARGVVSRRLPDHDGPWVDGRMTNHLFEFANLILGIHGGGPMHGDGDKQLQLYAATVNYRNHGVVSREEIPRLFESDRVAAKNFSITGGYHNYDWNPADGSFHLSMEAMEAFDSLESSGLSGVNIIDFKLVGHVTTDGHTAIRYEKMIRKPIYTIEYRLADLRDASNWVRALDAALHAGSSESLDALFHPLSAKLGENPPGKWFRPGYGQTGTLIDFLKDGSFCIEPSGVTIEGVQPGARTRISIPLRTSTGTIRKMSADLIHSGGAWRCVMLAI